MKSEKELSALEEVAYRFQHDRIFLNNPVIMQGMGLAPLVVVATSGQNAAILALAVALLLAPTRVLASVLLRNVKSSFCRVVGYTTIASVIYIGVYYLLERWFGNGLVPLGIYLPILVVEPLIIYRFGRVHEPVKKAIVKGLRMSAGYALVLMIVGLLRELLAVGTVFGVSYLSVQVLPLAALPAGGFILVGVISAIWRGTLNHYRKHATMKARLEK